MDLNDLTQRIAEVGELYASRFGIQRNGDWYLLKLQEEIGELCAAWLAVTKRTRPKTDDGAPRTNLENEIADVLAHTLLLAATQSIDVEQALKRKWLCYTKAAATDPQDPMR